MNRVLLLIVALVVIGAAHVRPTEAQGWTCNWSFATSGVPSGWTLVAGTVTADGVRAAYIYGPTYIAQVNFPSSVTLTSVTVTFKTTTSLSVRTLGALIADTTATQNGTFTESGSGSVSGNGWYIDNNSGSDQAYIVSADMVGTGDNPCPATPTPLPPTATNTPLPPTATNTPMPTSTGVPYPTDAAFIAPAASSDWSNEFNMTYGLQGWNLITGSLVGDHVLSACVDNRQRLEMAYPLTNVRLTNLIVAYEAGDMHTFEVKDGGTVFEAVAAFAGEQLIQWQGEHVMVNGELRISIIGKPGCDVSAFQLSKIFIRAYGENPSGLPATPIAFQTGDLYGGLSEANVALNSLPDALGAAVPAETGRVIFGYAKWLFSPSSADELAGPFAPIISHTGVFFTVTFGMALAYAIVWGAIWILRLVVWLFKIILSIVQLIVSNAIVVLIVAVVAAVLAVIVAIVDAIS